MYKYILIFFYLSATLFSFEISPITAVNLASLSYKTKYEIDQISKKQTLDINTTHAEDFIFFSSKDRLIVTFSGSKNVQNWHTNISIQESNFLDMSKVKVHGGFYREAQEAYEILKPEIAKSKKIIIIGHSLGGAVGQLFGALCLVASHKPIEIYSFGAPPVGNEEFVKIMKDVKHYRFRHPRDVIANINTFDRSLLQDKLNYVEKILPQEFYPLVSTLQIYVQSANYQYFGEEILVQSEQSNQQTPEELGILMLAKGIYYHLIYEYKKAVTQKYGS